MKKILIPLLSIFAIQTSYADVSGYLTPEGIVNLEEQSGAKLKTGGANSFSPIDLFVSSVGACSLYTMYYYAKQNNITVTDIGFTATQEFQYGPKRIKKMIFSYKLKTSANEENFKKVIVSAERCPLRQSLHKDIEISEKFERMN